MLTKFLVCWPYFWRRERRGQRGSRGVARGRQVGFSPIDSCTCKLGRSFKWWLFLYFKNCCVPSVGFKWSFFSTGVIIISIVFFLVSSTNSASSSRIYCRLCSSIELICNAIALCRSSSTPPSRTSSTFFAGIFPFNASHIFLTTFFNPKKNFFRFFQNKVNEFAN